MSLGPNSDTHRTMVLHFIAIITWTIGYIKQKIITRHTYNHTKATGMIQSEFVYNFTIRVQVEALETCQTNQMTLSP